jgi:NADPH:quinone reductase-like Zn-dependent oxidoreductase
VLVRTEAPAVDQADTVVRSAYRTPTPFPFIIGRDLVGTVAASGPGAAGFAEGDQVWCNSLGHGGRQGSFAQHVVVAGAPAGEQPQAGGLAAVFMFARLAASSVSIAAKGSGPGPGASRR